MIFCWIMVPKSFSFCPFKEFFVLNYNFEACTFIEFKIFLKFKVWNFFLPPVLFICLIVFDRHIGFFFSLSQLFLQWVPFFSFLFFFLFNICSFCFFLFVCSFKLLTFFYCLKICDQFDEKKNAFNLFQQNTLYYQQHLFMAYKLIL